MLCRLTSLNLYMNEIGDIGAEKIAEALKENKTLETLDIGGNNIYAMGMGVRCTLKENNARHISRQFKHMSIINSHIGSSHYGCKCALSYRQSTNSALNLAIGVRTRPPNLP